MPIFRPRNNLSGSGYSKGSIGQLKQGRYGSTTTVVTIVKKDVYNAIRDTFLEEEKGRLSYSELYKEVIQRLANITSNNKISYRDFSLILQAMVNENKLHREDPFKKRGSKVYYSLTEYAKKEYQYNILGIDKKKEKLRKLYQLLFFYEIRYAIVD